MNNRMKVAITMILVGAVAIAAAVGVWYYKTKFYVPDKGGMERDLSDTVISCSYSTGGGMNGGSMSMRIFLNENNEVWFEYYNQPFVGAEEESASYRIDNTAIEQIRQKCSEYGVLGWGELELSELQLLDAPITSVSFAYGDNEHYSVRSDYDLPEQGYGFFSAFYKILEQYKTQGGN